MARARAACTSVAVLSAVVVLACAQHAAAATELLAVGTCVNEQPLAPWVAVHGEGWECCNNCPDADADRTVIYPGYCSGPACETRNNPLLHELVQVVDVSAYASGIGDGSVVFALSGEMRTYCGIDTAMLALSFVDAGGAVLSTTKSCRYQDSVWASSVMVLTPPTSTRAVWVHLIAEARGGNDADGYFNNLSLLACTPGDDCPAPVTLVCPRMATAVSAGPALDDLIGACPGLMALSSAAGVEFPVVKRTGYCTKTCKVVFAQFDSAVTGAKAPTCQEYAVVAAILTRELSLARRECKNPVADGYEPPRSGALSSARPDVAVAAVAAACIAVALSVGRRAAGPVSRDVDE